MIFGFYWGSQEVILFKFRGFFVKSVFTTPLAVFFKLKFSFNVNFIPSGGIILAFALRTN